MHPETFRGARAALRIFHSRAATALAFLLALALPGLTHAGAPPRHGNAAGATPANLGATGDLSVSVTWVDSPIVPGQQYAYTIWVRNLGTTNVPYAVVRETPAQVLTGLTWTCQTTGGASCAAAGVGALDDVVLSMPAGSTARFTVSGVILPNTLDPVAGSVRVDLGANMVDRAPADNVSTYAVPVRSIGNLITTLELPPSVRSQEVVALLGRVLNAGPSTAHDVNVQFDLPPGLTVLSSSTGCTPVDGSYACMIPQIPPGSTETVVLEARIDAAGPASLPISLAAGSEVTVDPLVGDSTAAGTIELSEEVPPTTDPQDDRTGLKKGAILFFPKVELRWRPPNPGELVVTGRDLVQDTFLSLSNDGEQATRVKLYLVHGDAPLEPVDGDNDGQVEIGNPLDERGHPGWNFVDMTGILTRENPVYWSASTGGPAFSAGLSGRVTPWRILDLDPGVQPGRPDPLGSMDRVLRGYVVGWAIMEDETPVRWNRLSGLATIVNYAESSACEYEPFAFQALGDPNTESPTTPVTVGNTLWLDGAMYDNAPGMLLFDFYADSVPESTPPILNAALSQPGLLATVETELTLLPLQCDFAAGGHPRTTALVTNIWNENESRLSFGGHDCVTCWESQALRNLLLQYRVDILQTDRGKARIESVGNVACDGVAPGDVSATGVIGVAVKRIDFNGRTERAASPLVIQQVEPPGNSWITFDRPIGSGNLAETAPTSATPPLSRVPALNRP